MGRSQSRQLWKLLPLAALVAWVVTVTGAAPSSAEPLRHALLGDPVAEPLLADALVDHVERRVDLLLPPALAGTVERLHFRGRAIEYRHPLEWNDRPVELRLRGGRIKGKRLHDERLRGRGPRGYGVRLELRF